MRQGAGRGRSERNRGVSGGGRWLQRAGVGAGGVRGGNHYASGSRRRGPLSVGAFLRPRSPQGGKNYALR